MKVLYPWGGAQTDAVWALAGVKKTPLAGGDFLPLVNWRSDGTGTATTWAEVMSQIGTDRDVPIVCDQPGDVLTVPPGVYEMRGAFFLSPGLATQVDVEVQDGALLRNMPGARGGVFLVFHADTGPCLAFDVPTTGAVQFSLEGNATARNAGTGSAACVLGNGLSSTTFLLVLEQAGNLQGGDAFPVFALTNTIVVAIVVARTAQTPIGDNTIAGDAASVLGCLQDGSLRGPPNLAAFLGTVGNVAFGACGGVGPTSFRPVPFFEPIPVGCRYYDTDLAAQIYWDGAAWLAFGSPGGVGVPNAAAFYNAVGAATSVADYLAGALDAFQRPCVRDFRLGPTLRGAVYKLGAWGEDGDPQNVVSEGYVTYGTNAPGVGPSGTDGGLGFYTPNSFGCYQAIGGGPVYPSCAYGDGGPSDPFGVNGFVLADDAGVEQVRMFRGTGLVRCQELQAGGAAGRRVLSGPGSPEGVVLGSPGDTWLRTDGAAGTSQYVKSSGVGTVTGWIQSLPPVTFTDSAVPVALAPGVNAVGTVAHTSQTGRVRVDVHWYGACLVGGGLLANVALSTNVVVNGVAQPNAAALAVDGPTLFLAGPGFDPGASGTTYAVATVPVGVPFSADLRVGATFGNPADAFSVLGWSVAVTDIP